MKEEEPQLIEIFVSMEIVYLNDKVGGAETLYS